MRKLFFVVALLAGLVWATAAQAAVETYLDCPNIPGCGTITCVMVAIKCDNGCDPCNRCGCQPKGPLFIDFLDQDQKVLGSGKIEGDWCSCASEAELDNPVDTSQVCSVRVVKADEDCDICALVLWGNLTNECSCSCGKWWKIWKGSPCEWNQIVEEAPAPPPPPPAPPAPAPVPPPPPAPAPRPLPPPPPAPEPIPVVPGNG